MSDLESIRLAMREQLNLEMLDHIKSGKMLRSQLMLKIYNSTKSSVPKERIIALCAVMELIQLASLLHDDVIDNSNLRRGERTINAIYGDKSAIMLGDIVYSSAFLRMLDFGEEISRSIAQAVVNLSYGELMDVNGAKIFNQESYFKLIELKTACLFASCCEVVAILIGLDSKKYYDFGLNLGVCYQIIDDLLDIKSDTETLGKSAFSDLKEGKITLHYILLHELLEKSDRDKLEKVIASKESLSEPDKDWILEKFRIYEIEKKVFQIASSYTQRALELVENDSLKSLAKEMLKRIR